MKIGGHPTTEARSDGRASSCSLAKEQIITAALAQQQEADNSSEKRSNAARQISHPRTVLSYTLWPLLALLLLISILCLTLVPPSLYDEIQSGFACDPNGQVRMLTHPNTTLWDTEYTFAVSLGMRHLSFSAVKVLDVVWDLLVGRGGQVLVAIALYTVFRPATLTLLRNDALPHEHVLAMQYSQASLWAFKTLMKRVWGANGYITPPAFRSGFRRLYTTALLLSTAYLLVFPTWLSAMTLYQAPTVPVLPGRSHAVSMAIRNPTHCDAVITNGERVDLPNWACVKRPSALWDTLHHYNNHLLPLVNSTPLGWYTQYYSDIPTKFHYNDQTFDLPAPSLVTYVDDFNNNLFWFSENTTWTSFDMVTRGVCQPQHTYNWGFSFLLLFSFLVVSCALACLICLVQCCSWRLDRSDGVQRDKTYYTRDVDRLFGSLTTAVTVGESVREQTEVIAIGSVTNSEMRKRVWKRNDWMRFTGSTDEGDQTSLSMWYRTI